MRLLCNGLHIVVRTRHPPTPWASRANLDNEKGREDPGPSCSRSRSQCFATNLTIHRADRLRVSAHMLGDELRHLEHGDLLLAAEDGLEAIVGIDHPAI